MRIKFLQTTPSRAPEYPFRAGQTIEVAGLTPEVRAWLESGLVEVLKDEPEAATVAAAERAVTPRAARRDRVLARHSV